MHNDRIPNATLVQSKNHRVTTHDVCAQARRQLRRAYKTGTYTKQEKQKIQKLGNLANEGVRWAKMAAKKAEAEAKRQKLERQRERERREVD